MTGRNKIPLEILVVDDNPGDLDLVREILSESELPLEIRTVTDGMKAMAYLHREEKYAAAATPDFILLDLNLPRKDGRQVLADIKDNPALCHIPVVIFTTSQAYEDIITSYYNQVNCFITKPIDLDEFIDRIRAIERFWLQNIFKAKNRLKPVNKTIED